MSDHSQRSDPSGPVLEPGVVDGDWEYQPVRLPPDVTKVNATAELGLRVQFGGWELARTLLYADGTRKVWLRRRISRSLRATPA